MGYPMTLAKDYGFGTVFSDRRSFLMAVRAAFDGGLIDEKEVEELWLFGRNFERAQGLSGDLSRFSTDGSFPRG